MKIPLAFLIPLLALGVHAGWAADEGKPGASPAQVSVRMRFVPAGPPQKGSSDFRGASFTALDQGPVKGELWCQAHAGVGDDFPVKDKEGVTLFEVLLAAGNDGHLVLEVRSKEGVKKIDLPRDRPAAVEVAGLKYNLLYPSVSVAGTANEKPTTNKAMLMITRRP